MSHLIVGTLPTVICGSNLSQEPPVSASGQSPEQVNKILMVEELCAFDIRIKRKNMLLALLNGRIKKVKILH